MLNRQLSKTEYESPPEYEKIMENSIFTETYYDKKENNYYSDNLTPHDLSNYIKYEDTLNENTTVHKINEMNYKKNTENMELKYDPYKDDYFFIVKCSVCSNYFTRYEKNKNTDKYLKCNQCYNEQKKDCCLNCCIM